MSDVTLQSNPINVLLGGLKVLGFGTVLTAKVISSARAKQIYEEEYRESIKQFVNYGKRRNTKPIHPDLLQ